MRKENLWIKLLEPHMINARYIHGAEEICNYELYLVELINHCQTFRSRFREPFMLQREQSHGEADAVSGDYSLDFKLAVSSTAMQANSIHRSQIWKCSDGWTVYGGAKNEKGRLLVTKIYSALLSSSRNNLLSVVEKPDKSLVEKDIAKFLEKVSIPKNILFFFPYRLWHKGESVSIEEGIQDVVLALSSAFLTSMQYRAEKVSEYETFFSTFYEEKFVLLHVCEDKFDLLDIVDLSLSPTYKSLKQYSDPFEH